MGIATTSQGRGETKLALPGKALLEPPREPSCNYAPPKASEAVGADGPGPEPKSDADKIRKLDFEQQCYRMAEIIARDRLEKLQASVRAMMKATGGEAAR